jgi:hypothetical protein
MLNETALLVAVLAFAVAAMAADPSNTNTTNATKGPNKSQGTIQLDSMQFGVSQSLNNPVGKASGKEGGSASLSQIHLTPPVRTVVGPLKNNSTVTNPCKLPNPPHSCKQPKPSH